ncbi:MAG: PhzF family phenazine biosynthesis protein, partial [Pyrinomonadaceae bacterium]
IIEDPATGGAAGPLGAYLVFHDAVGFEPTDDKFRVVIEQGDFMRRPSRIQVEITGEAGKIDVVRVGGPAVVVAECELLLD